MTRKIIWAIISASLIVAFIFLFNQFNRNKTSYTDTIAAVPLNAAFIFQTSAIEHLWKNIENNNIIWSELLVADFFNSLNKEIKSFENFVSSGPLLKLIHNKKIMISAHQAGGNNFNFLFNLHCPAEIGVDNILNYLKEFDPAFQTSNREFENNAIYAVQLEKQVHPVYFTIMNSILSISASQALIEDAIKHQLSKNNLIHDIDFYTAYETMGNKVDGNLLLNFSPAEGLLQTMLHPDQKEKLEILKTFGNWAALDLNLKPNLVMLNGFTTCNDSLKNYLNLFKNQKPQSLDFLKIAPSKTAYFLFYGFSNFNAYLTEFIEEFDSRKLIEFETDFQTTSKIDLRKNLFNWVGNEVISLSLEPVNESNIPKFGIFKSTSLENALSSLQAITDSLVKLNSHKEKSEIYKDFKINQLPIDNALELYLGKAFSNIINPFYINIGRYIIYASDPSDIKDFIDYFISDKILLKDVSYQSFSENLSNEANLYLYSNIAKSPKIYAQLSASDIATSITNNLPLFDKFSGFAIQMNSNGKLFYNNIILKYDPINKEESTSLWETKLDSSISQKPRIVVNHTNNTKEIFVQDDANTIYLISNTGKIIWKKQLDEKIVGELVQVDVFKNKKLQYLFNTKSKIYLLDRNGSKVEKFPITLPSETQTSLTLFDYDNNKDYRILVSCNDKKTYNYNGTGELVEGWKNILSETPFKRQFQHISIAGKDFIINIDDAGKIYAVDRRGEARLTLREKLNISTNNDFFIEKGKDLTSSKIVGSDANGVINKLSLSDELEKIIIKEYSKNHFFDFKDINNDRLKEYIFMDENSIEVYEQNLNKIYSYQFENEITSPSQFFLFPDNTGKIGVLNAESQLIYVLDEYGNLLTRNPLKGRTHFSISNINKDENYNIVVGSDNYIYAYPIK